MPHLIDIHVGSKARGLRALRDLSQTQLADQLGLSFQQVQKYETGANRISARRLYDLAKIFNVPVSYFYEGLDDATPEAVSEVDMKAARMAGRIGRIPNEAARDALYELVKVMAKGEAE